MVAIDQNSNFPLSVMIINRPQANSLSALWGRANSLSSIPFGISRSTIDCKLEVFTTIGSSPGIALENKAPESLDSVLLILFVWALACLMLANYAAYAATVSLSVKGISLTWFVSKEYSFELSVSVSGSIRGISSVIAESILESVLPMALPVEAERLGARVAFVVVSVVLGSRTFDHSLLHFQQLFMLSQNQVTYSGFHHS